MNPDRKVYYCNPCGDHRWGEGTNPTIHLSLLGVTSPQLSECIALPRTFCSRWNLISKQIKHNARERNWIFTERMPATTVLNGLFNVLAQMTWDVDAQRPAAVSSSLTVDQPIHTVGTICAQIARYSLRQTTKKEHAVTVEVTKHESTIESKSEADPSNWN